MTLKDELGYRKETLRDWEFEGSRAGKKMSGVYKIPKELICSFIIWKLFPRNAKLWRVVIFPKVSLKKVCFNHKAFGVQSWRSPQTTLPDEASTVKCVQGPDWRPRLHLSSKMMWGTPSCLLGDRSLEGIQVEEENACVGPGEQASFIRDQLSAPQIWTVSYDCCFWSGFLKPSL